MGIESRCLNPTVLLGTVGTLGAYLIGLPLYPASLVVGGMVAAASFGSNLAKRYYSSK